MAGGTSASEGQTGQHTVIEGLPTLRALAKIAELSNIDLPVLHLLHGIVAGSVTPLVGLQRLMSREMKSEFQQTSWKGWSGDKVGSCGSGCSEDRLFQNGCGKRAAPGFEHFQQGVAGRS
jgi:hypothetical protein